MSLEQKINYQLNKYPIIKKAVKLVYQHGMYAISKKVKSEGKITRISPNDLTHEYFFGYYDKSPWDITDRYMLCMKATDTWSDVSPKESADIVLIDTKKTEDDPDRVKKIAETRAWNVQQSCMLQWLGPDFSSKILYNDYRDGKYVSVILTLRTMEETVIPAAVYSVSADGKYAMTLDFSRLYELRPGYGYYNVPEKTKGVTIPDTTAIWRVDLETGEVKDVLKYTDFANFKSRAEMKEEGAVHKVNHIMLSPNGKRFMVLYRWFIGDRKYTRLITCNVDGTDMYLLSDDDMVSHCFWKDDNHIIAFENKKKSGTGYYLMEDKTDKYYHCWPDMTGDGHPSFSPDRSLVVTDTYPDRARIAYLKIMDGDVRKREVNTIAKVYAPFKYDNDTRCDLHPRWNHAGDKICFDSVFEGRRGLYVVDISEYKVPTSGVKAKRIEHSNPKYSVITPMYNSFGLMSKYFQTLGNQTYKNFEIVIVDDCSTDDSYEKALKYADKSELSITVLKSEQNAGPGNARNIGINTARGKYLLFIDSDDFVSNKLFEKIEKYSNSADMIFFDYYRTDGIEKNFGKTIKHNNQKLTKKEVLLNSTTSVCGKVVDRDIILKNKILFPDIYRFEDWVFMSNAILESHNYAYVEEGLYYYYENQNSIVNTSPQKAYKYSTVAYEELKEKLCAFSGEVSEALYAREVIYVAAKELALDLPKKEFWKEIDGIQTLHLKWRKNKYISKFSYSHKIILFLVKYRLYNLMKLLIKIYKK
ncbi:glycosyltransferase [Mediterraneibacter gnavus]|jgi:glycosyltransferase involved in cell wall biosynthesis|uniref:glycosyltransferase n=1 Tax=Mediterraneibacter gnavus TaxID=33038 RepID=UPI00374FC98A